MIMVYIVMRKSFVDVMLVKQDAWSKTKGASDGIVTELLMWKISRKM